MECTNIIGRTDSTNSLKWHSSVRHFEAIENSGIYSCFDKGCPKKRTKQLYTAVQIGTCRS